MWLLRCEPLPHPLPHWCSSDSSLACLCRREGEEGGGRGGREGKEGRKEGRERGRKELREGKQGREGREGRRTEGGEEVKINETQKYYASIDEYSQYVKELDIHNM